MYQTNVTVPQDYVGYVNGKGSRTIDAIGKKPNTNIRKIPGKPCFSINGDERSCYNAKIIIKETAVRCFKCLKWEIYILLLRISCTCPTQAHMQYSSSVPNTNTVLIMTRGFLVGRSAALKAWFPYNRCDRPIKCSGIHLKT